MTDPDAGTTNPDAEAKALAAKTPAPAGFILGITAAEANERQSCSQPQPANIAAAIASVEAAQKSISTAGDVTGDTALASSGCATAL
jgi:hypothetical protein